MEVAEVASAEAQERCTMQPAPIVESRLKSRSNLMDPGQYIARSATRSTGQPGHQADIETI